ncbi:MAG: competence/damage-inducible protein A [Capsulimonadaceae bacterium]
MIAEIISVGTELLLGQIVDTNAAYIAQSLATLGISIYHRVTVGDNTDRLAEALLQALSRSDLVITIGGLGPTMDDLTRETVAQVMNIALVEDHEAKDHLEEIARLRHWSNYPESWLKQVLVPSQGYGVPNRAGTALGAFFAANGKIAVCLPGPPTELIPMLDEQIIPDLAKRLTGKSSVIHSRTLRVTGLGEPAVEDRVRDLILSHNPTIAPYAKGAEVHLRMTASAPDLPAANALLDPLDRDVRERLGDAVYGIDEENLELHVVKALVARQMTLATAESCTGGLVAKRITDVPDASRVFGLGMVTYSNEAKMHYVGVDPDDLKAHGAVSHAVARAMAAGIRNAAGADIGVSTTGIAGPGGGSPEKPVGTVYVGISFGDTVYSDHFLFLGQRADIALRTSQAALGLVRRAMLRPESLAERSMEQR